MRDDQLPDHLIKAVKHGVSGLDIIHGELKNLMVEMENYLLYEIHEQQVKDYLEGMLDGYVKLYNLTYLLSFEGVK